MIELVVLQLPLAGPCLVQNSPARRVPSHGTDVMATTYAIDLVPVDQRGRSAEVRDWRTWLATEPPERFVGFGAPVLAPVDGTVVHVHDGEPDHHARRSSFPSSPTCWVSGSDCDAELRASLATTWCEAGARTRVRRAGAPATWVDPGSRGRSCACRAAARQVRQLRQLTEPHVHLQVMDGSDPMTARGVPLAFARFRERRRGGAERWVESACRLRDRRSSRRTHHGSDSGTTRLRVSASVAQQPGDRVLDVGLGPRPVRR